MPHITTQNGHESASLFAKLFARTDANVAPQKKSYHTAFPSGSAQTYMSKPGQPVWMRRDYARFADEAYVKNVIAHRAIAMIAEGAASVPLQLHEGRGGDTRVLSAHPLRALLARPNPFCGGSAFFEALYTHRLISGNAFIQAVGPKGEAPLELHVLRPDRVKILAGKNGLPMGYRYQVGEKYTDYPVDRVTGQSRILHLKYFHPLDDWYGLSPVEAAAYSIDQHNQAGSWNQSLLQNGARPSGALIVKHSEETGTSNLSEEQYMRIKEQMESEFSGSHNAGRPLLLEGGLEWKEMSLSPKDMDYVEMKHSAARDIALAFGVPPQLLGIPGDNTYSNLAEARLALWEQTILPSVQHAVSSLNNWLTPMFGNALAITIDTNNISALAYKREKLWERVSRADFLSDEEKKRLVGFSE